MIKDEAIARQISELMLDFGARLDQSVKMVEDNCTPEEFAVYRRSVGAIMAEMLLGVMNPLYADHPALKPPELK